MKHTRTIEIEWHTPDNIPIGTTHLQLILGSIAATGGHSGRWYTMDVQELQGIPPELLPEALKNRYYDSLGYEGSKLVAYAGVPYSPMSTPLLYWDKVEGKWVACSQHCLSCHKPPEWHGTV